MLKLRRFYQVRRFFQVTMDVLVVAEEITRPLPGHQLVKRLHDGWLEMAWSSAPVGR